MLGADYKKKGLTNEEKYILKTHGLHWKSFQARVLIVREEKNKYVVILLLIRTLAFLSIENFTAKFNISDMTIVHYENSIVGSILYDIYVGSGSFENLCC